LILAPGIVQPLELDWPRYCSVAMEGAHIEGPLYHVSNDYRHAARLAFRHVLKLGYRRVGLLIPADWSHPGRELMIAGFCLEQAALHSRQQIPPFEQASPSPAQLAVWLKAHQPEALLCPLCQGLSLLREAEKTLGGSCAFVSLIDSDEEAGIAGMAVDHEALAGLAVTQLITLMRSNQRGSSGSRSCTYTPAFWRDGASCQPRFPAQL
jgi:LacI family transcriptional regulator